jgi:HD-like signal output (HDOD) protein
LRAARAAVTDMRDTQLIYEAERKILGFDHTTVGALLARAWHFPDTLVECMSFHHSPLSSTEGFQELVSIIHIASGCASGLDAEDPEAEPGVAASIDPAAWAYANIRPEQIPAFFAGARQRVDAMLGTLL